MLDLAGIHFGLRRHDVVERRQPKPSAGQQEHAEISSRARPWRPIARTRSGLSETGSGRPPTRHSLSAGRGSGAWPYAGTSGSLPGPHARRANPPAGMHIGAAGDCLCSCFVIISASQKSSRGSLPGWMGSHFIGIANFWRICEAVHIRDALEEIKSGIRDVADPSGERK